MCVNNYSYHVIFGDIGKYGFVLISAEGYYCYVCYIDAPPTWLETEGIGITANQVTFIFKFLIMDAGTWR